MIQVICPFCNATAQLKQGLWRCDPCCALGEVDVKTKKLKGIMANQITWSLRKKCYAIHDELMSRHKLNGFSKTKARQSISDAMNIVFATEEDGLFKLNRLDEHDLKIALEELEKLNQKTVPICPYCLNESNYLQSKNLYRCDPCDAQVGVHKDTTMPLGTMANKELRAMRKKAHSYLDPLWKYKASSQNISKMKARKAAYEWLAKQMEIKVDDCHVGEFDVEQCQQVIKHCSPYIHTAMSKLKKVY